MLPPWRRLGRQASFVAAPGVVAGREEVRQCNSAYATSLLYVQDTRETQRRWSGYGRSRSAIRARISSCRRILAS